MRRARGHCLVCDMWAALVDLYSLSTYHSTYLCTVRLGTPTTPKLGVDSVGGRNRTWAVGEARRRRQRTHRRASRPRFFLVFACLHSLQSVVVGLSVLDAVLYVGLVVYGIPQSRESILSFVALVSSHSAMVTLDSGGVLSAAMSSSPKRGVCDSLVPTNTASTAGLAPSWRGLLARDCEMSPRTTTAQRFYM